MELCVMNSAATKLNLFPSSSSFRSNRSRLFRFDPLFLSCSCSLSRFGGKLSSIRPLQLSRNSNRISCFGESPRNGSIFRRFATSSTVDAGVEEDRLPADLLVTETVEPNSRVRLSVEVPPVVCEDCYKQVIKKFMKKAKVPGFRPGKVPESILIDYIGKKQVQSAVVESILKRTLPHSMSSMTGRALKDSIRIATSFAEIEKTFASSKVIRYDIVVDIAPEIRWNPEDGYKNLKVVVEIDSDIDAKQACEKEIRQRHKSLGALKIVTDRGLQVGDLAVIDISAATIGQDGSDGQNIPDAESKGFHFDTEDGDKVLPGFLDSIVGIRPGETKSFPLTFPDTWKQEYLRGLSALFTVTCKELFYRDLPPLDDSLADKLLPGCTTLNEVQEALLQKLQEMEQNAKEQAADNAILDQLRKMVEVEIPQSLFEEQGRQFYGARLLEIQSKMKLSEEQLASLSSPKSVNEFLESQRESIINIIKQNLAVGDIFKRENLEVSTDEVVKEVENSIAEFKKHKQEYDEDRVKDQVQDILEGAKVLEWLKERADIQYVTR